MDCVSQDPKKLRCCNQEGECSDDMCPETHTCCWQTPPQGKPTLGICVLKDKDGKKGNCDFSRGIPVKDCKDPSKKQSESYEKKTQHYVGAFVENYENDNDDSKCSNWETACYIMGFIMLLLFVLVISRKCFQK